MIEITFPVLLILIRFRFLTSKCREIYRDLTSPTQSVFALKSRRASGDRHRDGNQQEIRVFYEKRGPN